MLEGELKEGPNGVATVSLTAGGSVSLPSSRVPSDVTGTVKVGVRPEKLTVTRGEDAAVPPGFNQVSGGSR